jgi:ribokinase
MTVVVFGSINMDLTAYVPSLPQPGETLFGSSYITAPGGKGANQAVAAARLGATTRFVGRVGRDGFGRQVMSAIGDEGVDMGAVAEDADNGTGLAVISVDEAAENAIIVISGANMALDHGDVSRCEALLDEGRVLLLQMEVPLEASLDVARAARRRGVQVVFDPAPASPLSAEAYTLFDVITPNEGEAEILLGQRPATPAEAQEAAAALRSRGARAAVVKMGAQGAAYATASERGFVSSFSVKAIDTVAAGDAFNGGLGVALAEGQSLPHAVRWACAAGALATTREGAVPAMPRRDELLRLLEEQADPGS